MKSLLEPIELALLKQFSNAFSENSFKTYFNYYEEDTKTTFIDSKIQELGNRAFGTDDNAVLILYKRTTPLVQSSMYGKTGMPKKLIAIDNETGKGFEKDYVICQWTYDFNVLAKTKGNEEFAEFIFNFFIKKMKNVNFSIKVKNFTIPLSYSLSIEDLGEFAKIDGQFLDNVYYFNFSMTIDGMVLSPFSRDRNIELLGDIFEIRLFGEKTSFDAERDQNELVSVIKDDKDSFTFEDLTLNQSLDNEEIVIKKS
jgi:hypothetical protein